MHARVDEISDRIYRISTCIQEVAPGGFTFNQFLVNAEEPLLYHTGMRSLFPLVKEAVERIIAVDRLRWISFAHVEADECGAVNEFLTVAPHAQVVQGELGCLVSLNDLCNRPPRPMADGETLDIGGATLQRRLVAIRTPHVPHNWESHMMFELETGTLLLGDLCSQFGDGAALTDDDLLDAAVAAEDLFHYTSLGPAVPATYRRLADLKPATLAVMHGSSYAGDCPRLLRALAEVYQDRYGCAKEVPSQSLPAHEQPVG